MDLLLTVFVTLCTCTGIIVGNFLYDFVFEKKQRKKRLTGQLPKWTPEKKLSSVYEPNT
jgi:hypothetical protein